MGVSYLFAWLNPGGEPIVLSYQPTLANEKISNLILSIIKSTVRGKIIN